MSTGFSRPDATLLVDIVQRVRIWNRPRKIYWPEAQGGGGGERIVRACFLALRSHSQKTKQNKLTIKHNQKNTVRTSQMEILLLISTLKRHGNQMIGERYEQELKKKKRKKLA